MVENLSRLSFLFLETLTYHQTCQYIPYTWMLRECMYFITSAWLCDGNIMQTWISILHIWSDDSEIKKLMEFHVEFYILKFNFSLVSIF